MKVTTSILIIFLSFQNINAQQSTIIGFWQLTTVEVDNEIKTGFQTIFIFAEQGVLKASRSVTSQPIEVGTWKYDESLNSIIMESEVDRDFRGTASNVKVDEQTLSYKHNGAILNFTKTEIVKPNNDPIPTLSFTEDDFWQDDEYKYQEDEEKLPWTLEELFDFMKNKNEIVYTVDNYKMNYGKVDTWVNSYKVSFSDANEISLREYSYFHQDYIDMSDNFYPLNDDTKENKVFYPRTKLGSFRVIGEEVVETNLGKFTCTVVEGMGDFDQKLKYWMINEQPGVYSKIIIHQDSGNPNFDYNNVYTLKEIK